MKSIKTIIIISVGKEHSLMTQEINKEVSKRMDTISNEGGMRVTMMRKEIT